MLRDARGQQVAEIRDFLGQIYNTQGTRVEDLDSLTDDEVIALAKNLKGVCRWLRRCLTVPKSTKSNIC
ncbi:hypothetical protein HSBAA_02990 [Vreelandella sulfidaeris]|uniref:Uncharacterized protein n=1 Tax=Vreelandella sulfidaeris TaxID=115553 RepID=A0A455U1G3_9GAMM|nr:hypothetical protein HSBAA_02990 [Halomonas sulfidaeris]